MELTWMPAWQIRDLIAKGDVSPVEVTEHFLARAEELDPLLHAYRELDATGAREQAQRAEAAVRRGDELGALHGVPIAVKEHIAVEGLLWTHLGAYGGEPEPRAPAKRDAVAVSRLRDAGAIVLGTTVMPGMGSLGLMDPDGNYTDDLSLHPRNPWNLDHVPGSSSAGSCAAVSAGVLPVAIGSDGGGSTRLPAAWSGLLGLHPTMGRVPMGEPAATSWNTSFGPLTRDARDTAIILQAMSGPEGSEIVSLPSDPPDYLGDLDHGVAGLRMAWTDDFGFTGKYAGPESSRVIDAARTAAAGFSEMGATVETISETFPDWAPMLGLGPQGSPQSHEAFVTGQDCRAEWWHGLRRVFTDHDLLLTTTIQHVAFTVERWNEAWTTTMAEFIHQWCAHTFPHNFLGWPALSVPCGFVDGLPISIQITGRPDDEALILRAAQAFLAGHPQDQRPPIGA